ncbi:tRNA cyclic N6-threonylcarbamoyladenosine(37) synthase TcdA [Exilibacterium tricleocarpae]|uniref:tRNA cyclic N6-threonylcarbamoyladenosine(37) synthase TcdA n=1 Tax=Exilibacterium tricleocarpae TaxID=2591008 RepID=A0A545SY72_9GAMM|nr:tRNA cyclic N6-threonylcarbamoyladenosine(37) synthase TcdA [Exilibacterium tricleocarpae]TQV69910.1 tRNA cyclic N6-threonylcarbamoyladenosine(37) synthase TcdA [Exilibacterium tricleocarpae]
MTTPLSENYRHRFGGIARLYGQTALEQLHRAHFCVIGIGGVGSWVAESLARTGVGSLTLIDLDDICITNTNRQLHTLQETIGRPKTTVMGERLKAINPEIRVFEIADFLGRDNLEKLILPEHHLVIDAIDAAAVKAALIAFCRRRRQQIVTVGSAGGKRDPRQITSGDLSRTTTDPLLAKTRNYLRRLYNFSRNPKRFFSVEAVYSTEQLLYPDAAGGISHAKRALQGSAGLDCGGGLGAATMVTASFGFCAAARAVDRYLARA